MTPLQEAVAELTQEQMSHTVEQLTEASRALNKITNRHLHHRGFLASAALENEIDNLRENLEMLSDMIYDEANKHNWDM